MQNAGFREILSENGKYFRNLLDKAAEVLYNKKAVFCGSILTDI